MIRAIIIDDESAMQEVNSQLLAEYFPNIEQVGTANSITFGIALIQKENPDLVLLDIQLTDGSGFQLLQKLPSYDFKVVFITAFDSFAIKAIKFSAIDYILKPVNEIEFQQAIQRAVDLIKSKDHTASQVNVLMDSLKKEIQSKKLVLRTSHSIHIVDISDIHFCKSDNSYTTFYFEDDEKILVSKSLKDYESLLKEYGFFRPHQSYLVNLNHIKKVDKTDHGFIIMKNKKEIPISTRQMKNLINLLDSL
ncbi:LytTR family DNA-binding domain-containing protein [Algibacter sp. L4_22]|uniref:LytR/AlgR family response regulator transcription factor n=1 Tax=Algibacter sp. L4_22 TaxID=2942477 RepID=UPI00201B81B1|nr:LytTR family DNA-binding domain-containing protein [Algibacter sp. L4_22]MCL5130333.1 LytTR family DNA-binding domain-containing protein [Algibacter sp. L4_22]